MKRSHTVLLALLFFSGGYLYAFPSATVEVRWPSGRVDRLTDVAAGQVITVKEGEGLLSAQPFRKQ